MAATFTHIKDRTFHFLYRFGAGAVFLLCVLVFSAFMLDILELYILDVTGKANSTTLPEGLTIHIDERPIIGILAQEHYKNSSSKQPDGSYIAASYVKMVESSGARVVPIFIGKDRQYYEDIVKKVNGLLFPGGDADLWAKGGYGDATYLLYNLALEVNQNETHFPVYGVCLGMETLAVASADRSRDVVEPVIGTNNIRLALEFNPSYKRSGVFYSAPKQVIELLKTKITANHHSVSVTHETFKANGLVSTWRVLTTSGLKKGKRFISTMEHKQYPQIYGTQFHPEKIAFEWYEGNKDPHSLSAIIANRWFYDHFVQESRFNSHRFTNKEEEKNSLIYNYSPIHMGTYFEQIYFFPDNKPATTDEVLPSLSQV